MKKVKVYHFHNGSGGGVLSVIKNLLLYKQHDEIENHIIYTINKDLYHDFAIPHVVGAVSQQVFYYSASWNFFHTCKQLSKLFPEDAIIVAHDWLELGIVSNLGLQNKVIQILHGDFDYYYDLAFLHSDVIDKFICISATIQKKLFQKLSKRNNDILFKRFPVQDIPFTNKENDILQCIYFVRDLNDERKQFRKVIEIKNALNESNIFIKWVIIGGGVNQKEFDLMWGQNSDVVFKGFLSNEDIIKEFSAIDIFILPSLAEGLPVALVESMKAGLVPIINNWFGATSDLVIENETGFYCQKNEIEEYLQKIILIEKNRILLKSLSFNASQKANCLFLPTENTLLIEDVFLYDISIKNKISKKTYGSRLDQKWIPNILTSTIRKCFSLNN